MSDAKVVVKSPSGPDHTWAFSCAENVVDDRQFVKALSIPKKLEAVPEG